MAQPDLNQVEIDRILGKGRWGMVHFFESIHKRRFLSKLTKSESLRIFRDLCQFISKTSRRDYSKKIDMFKIQALSRRRELLRKIS